MVVRMEGWMQLVRDHVQWLAFVLAMPNLRVLLPLCKKSVDISYGYIVECQCCKLRHGWIVPCSGGKWYKLELDEGVERDVMWLYAQSLQVLVIGASRRLTRYVRRSRLSGRHRRNTLFLHANTICVVLVAWRGAPPLCVFAEPRSSPLVWIRLSSLKHFTFRCQ